MTLKDARIIQRSITANANTLCDAVDRLSSQLSDRNDQIAIREAEIKRLDEQLIKIREADNRANIAAYNAKQRQWSRKTFGEGKRTKGILAHIRKELAEIEANPDDLEEWIDVVILALDGYWRHGGEPIDLMWRLQAKQDINFARQWPTPGPEDEPVEHVREVER